MSTPIEHLGPSSESTIARPVASQHPRPHRPVSSDEESSGAVPSDRVSVSDDARTRSDATTGTRETASDRRPEGDEPDVESSAAPGAKPREAGERPRPKEGDGKLTAEQQEQVLRLRQRDAEVRAHEAAHQAVAGALGGGASFTFQLGPDGRQYAVGGEVPIEIGGGGTPHEMLSRARQVRAAALAPAKPSGQDLKVAASAAALETKAIADIQRQSVDRAAGKEKPKEHENRDPLAKEPAEAEATPGEGSAPVGTSPAPAPTEGVPPAADGARPPRGTPPVENTPAPPLVDDARGPDARADVAAPRVDGAKASDASKPVTDDADPAADARASGAASAIHNGWSSASAAFDALVSANATASLHSSGNCAHCSPHLVLAKA